MPMTKNNNYKIYYNGRHDVLNIHFPPNEPSVDHELKEYPGIFISCSMKNERITGITILDYKIKKNELDLDEILSSINGNFITLENIERNIN